MSIVPDVNRQAPDQFSGFAPGGRASNRDKPRVSVVIPAYNSADRVKEAIESVLAQSYSNFEIIVVDDGSTDNTERTLRYFGEQIRYFKQQNQGVSSARNAGIRNSRGEYVAFLDSDDIWASDKLAGQVPVLDGDPEVGLVYCDWSVMSGETVLRASYHKNLRPASGYVFNELIQRGFVLTSGVVVRRSCLEDVGCFDTTLTIAQDYDLWLRISYCWKIQLVDKCLFTKRSFDGSLSTNLTRTAVERIELYRKALRNLPDMTPRSRRLIKRQLAINYWDVGYEQFDRFSFMEARKSFASSFVYARRVKTLAYLAATYLPVSFARAAKAAWRAQI
jgi:glycosyltransferase involved in cell wall biosynthesis